MAANRKLENKNAVITGGSLGIGRAIARCFAEEGANLFLCARRAGPLEETANELRRTGVRVIPHVADASDQESVKEMVNHAAQEFQRIDILVNNVGLYIPRRFVDYTLDEFDRTIKVNVHSVFLVTQGILPYMMEQKKGRIINIASTAGKWGSRGQSAYNASKHAVVGLTRCIALETAPFNIRVNAVCPALVDETDMTDPLLEFAAKGLGVSKEEARKDAMSRMPIGRFIKPDEVAALCLYLASDESDCMTAQSIALCGGYTMI